MEKKSSQIYFSKRVNINTAFIRRRVVLFKINFCIRLILNNKLILLVEN